MIEKTTASAPTSSQAEKATESAPASSQPYRMRLPGFIADEDIGLGDVIKRSTYTLGIKPCSGCEGRAAALNRWFVFAGRTK
jgi:hypothetical protein